MIELTQETFEREILQAKEPALVDFWAPWCGPCRMLSPIVEELAKEYEGKMKFGKVNTDDYSEVAARYRITAIPSLLFFKNGRKVDELVGAQPKETIRKHIEQILAG